MKAAASLFAALALASAAASGASAPWYKWMSTVDRSVVCAQTSPGAGWTPYQGPFQDAQCRKAGLPH